MIHGQIYNHGTFLDFPRRHWFQSDAPWREKRCREPDIVCSWKRKTSASWIIRYLVIQSDFFGMVKWPFSMVKWPPTRWSKGHFESPGRWWFLKYLWNFHPECLGKLDPIWRTRIFFKWVESINHQLERCFPRGFRSPAILARKRDLWWSQLTPFEWLVEVILKKVAKVWSRIDSPAWWFKVTFLWWWNVTLSNG